MRAGNRRTEAPVGCGDELDIKTTLQLSPDVAFRPLGEGESAVLVETKTGQLFTCNETTTAFLQAIDGRREFGAIVDQLRDVFEVEPEILKEDLTRIASELIQNGLIRPVEKNEP